MSRNQMIAVAAAVIVVLAIIGWAVIEQLFVPWVNPNTVLKEVILDLPEAAESYSKRLLGPTVASNPTLSDLCRC
jgi:hypothetical protein